MSPDGWYVVYVQVCVGVKTAAEHKVMVCAGVLGHEEVRRDVRYILFTDRVCEC